MAYRNQWSGFNSAFRTYGLYYEQSLDRLNSGIGINLEGDNAGDGILKTTRLSAAYAYRLKITDDLNIRLGVEAGAIQTNLNWDKLIFPDQIDPILGVGNNTGEVRPTITSKTVLDIGSGLLLLSDKFYLGVALKHMNTPKDGLLLINDNITTGLPVRYVIQGGTDLFVNKGNKVRPASFISPNFLFVSQGPYRQLNIGAYAGVGPVFAGAWFRHTLRNSDAVIVSAGLRKGVFKIGFSYDITVSGLAPNAGQTVEFTLGLLFDQNENLRNKKKRPNINDCLHMFQ